MNLARRVLGKKGVYEQDGVTRQFSNTYIRERMRLTCVQDRLRTRRLKWVEDIMAHPYDNVQLRAALGGQLMLGNQKRIDKEYSPWLEQLAQDVLWYIARTKTLGCNWDLPRCADGERTVLGWKEQGTLVNLLDGNKMRWFARMTVPLMDLRGPHDPCYDKENGVREMGQVECQEVLNLLL